MMNWNRRATLMLLGLTGTCALAQTPAPVAPMAAAAQATSVRLRGTLQAVSANEITLKERSGEVIALSLSDKLTVAEVYPITLADITPGSFIGTAAMPQADGSQRAIAVTVFPESARGLAEGHRPFDLQPQSTMTNATVADVVGSPSGRNLRVKYQGGEKTIVVPTDAPIVTFKPADRSLLVVGASVSLTAQEIAGKPTALRINAGKAGFALPY